MPTKAASGAAEEEEEEGGAKGAALLGCGGVARSNFVCVKNGVGESVLARENLESVPEFVLVTPPRLDPARFGRPSPVDLTAS